METFEQLTVSECETVNGGGTILAGCVIAAIFMIAGILMKDLKIHR